MTPSQLQLDAACRALYAGGVVAYPTEAVWGLGCDPADELATLRLLELKRRDWRKGLILIGAEFKHVSRYIGDVPAQKLEAALASWPGPHTWLVPASAAVPLWVRGEHDSVALRVTAHPVAAALCRAWGGALVSTSANVAGRAPARSRVQIAARFGEQIDAVVPGSLGESKNPTTIRHLLTGKLIRS